MVGITTTAETGERRKDEGKVIDKNMRTDREKRKAILGLTSTVETRKKKTDPKKGGGAM